MCQDIVYQLACLLKILLSEFGTEIIKQKQKQKQTQTQKTRTTGQKFINIKQVPPGMSHKTCGKVRE